MRCERCGFDMPPALMHSKGDCIDALKADLRTARDLIRRAQARTGDTSWIDEARAALAKMGGGK